MKISGHTRVILLLFYITFCNVFVAFAQFESMSEGDVPSKTIKQNRINTIKQLTTIWSKKWELHSVETYDTNGLKIKTNYYLNNGQPQKVDSFFYDSNFKLIAWKIYSDNILQFQYNRIYKQINNNKVCSTYIYNFKSDNNTLTSIETYNNGLKEKSEFYASTKCDNNNKCNMDTFTFFYTYNDDRKLIKLIDMGTCRSRATTLYNYYKNGKLKNIDVSSSTYQSFSKFKYNSNSFQESVESFNEKGERTITKYMTIQNDTGLRLELCQLQSNNKYGCTIKFEYEFYK